MNASVQNFVDRLINLNTEKKEISKVISEVKTEMKSSGYDADAICEVVRRKMFDNDKLAKQKAKIEAARMYADSIGQASLFD